MTLGELAKALSALGVSSALQYALLQDMCGLMAEASLAAEDAPDSDARARRPRLCIL